MNIIHTADWHLGQSFYDFDRKREHLHFLAELKRHIIRTAADVLLIAGDVFDSPNPTADAQSMFYDFLHEAITDNPLLQIVIIAGNHDSAARLEAPNPLLHALRIHVRGAVRKTPDGLIDYSYLTLPLLRDGKIVAWCLAVPYLRYGDYPPAENYAQGVEKLFTELYRQIPDKRLPVIAMGHLQATGSELSVNDKSERTVIGGMEGVSPEVFADGIVYAALGHLHRAQRVSRHENVRYAGAPLPMSFAEINNRQSIVFVQTESGQTQIELIELSPLVKLKAIRATSVQDAFRRIDLLPEGSQADAPYLEIRIPISEPEPSLRHRVEEALKHKAVRLARLICETVRKQAQTHSVASFEAFQNITPMHMATDIFKRQYGGEAMPEAIKTLLKQVIDEAKENTEGK